MPVLVPLNEGVEEIEAVTVIDVLRRGGQEVTSVSLTHALAVHGLNGIPVLADTVWDAIHPASFDALVLPGGGKGAEHLTADARLVDALKRYHAEGRLVAAIGSAPTLLYALGLLEGRRATCHPTRAAELGDSYNDAPFVADGHVITGQGPGVAVLFSLALLRHLAGEETSRRVASGLVTAF